MNNKIFFIFILSLLFLVFVDATSYILSPNSASFAGTYQLTYGGYTDLASDDTGYISVGETRNNQPINATIQVGFSLSSLGITNKSAISSMNLSSIYCFSGTDTSPPACNANNADGTARGSQIESYNYTSAGWVSLGALSTNTGNEVSINSSWGRGFLDFIDISTLNVLVRYRIDYNAGNNQDNWLMVDYSALNLTYDDVAPSTTLVAVAEDTSSPYQDSLNDGVTIINVSGEAGMFCRWSTSDVEYSLMPITQECSVSGINSNCTTSPAQGYPDFYVSCKDSVGNSQTSSSNLNVESLTVDWTAPETNDSSTIIVQIPGYQVNITEYDNVDSDPTTIYCVDGINSCIPSISIDNGGLISFSNRGTNYLRYNSSDDLGNIQSVNKTININRLPVFLSAIDDSSIIKGGAVVNVSTQMYDLNSGQSMKLYVCNSSGATYSGCSQQQYCFANGVGNLTCTFGAENDSLTHTWYAYLYDELNESASNNPLTGSYTTDYTSPTITITSPENTTYTQSSVTASIVLNEAGNWAGYSLDNSANVSMTNTSIYIWTKSITGLSDGSHNITFYANDSYGNMENTSTIYFSINTAVADSTKPQITILSPINGTYYTSASILLNITSDETLSWAGFKNNSGELLSLGNVSVTNWNRTISLYEGVHLIEFYANDTSGNQGNSNSTIYVDLNNPQVASFFCNDANDSQNVVCYFNLTDSIGLSHALISWNATGEWQNSSQISLSGLSTNSSYNISSGNTSVGIFGTEIYVYDLSGRKNTTSSDLVSISDDDFPEIYNISYYPNTTALLDDGVLVRVNATIVDNYNVSNIVLMYRNSSVSAWTSVNMLNLSYLNTSGNINAIFNASFVPGNETWYFKINVTDSAGNHNMSDTYSFVVQNDTTFYNSTTIPDVKSFIYSERAGNNSLGYIFINNTGDSNLNFTVSLSSSSLSGRLSINNSLNSSMIYQINSGRYINITAEINTTDLTANLYNYILVISSDAGITSLSKQLNIQTANGPYLVVSINSFSSSVTKGQNGVEYSASVQNLGTQDASGVYLNWTLPSGFTLTSGSLSRELGNLGIGVSGSNTITINVDSSASDSYVNITAIASATSLNTTNTSKQITIGDPTIITSTSSSSSGSGGGGSGGGSSSGKTFNYSNEIEVVRGDENSFVIEVKNKYPNNTIDDLILNVTGYHSQYISIEPLRFDKLLYGETAKFIVKIKSPTYKDFEIVSLKTVASGYLNNGISKTKYTETQSIKLYIQEISRENVELSLKEAEDALDEMIKKGFYYKDAENILLEAKNKLNDRRNKEAYDLALKVIELNNKAFEISDFIYKVEQAFLNPRLTNLITGNVISSYVDENGNNVSLKNVVTGNAIFSSKSVEDLIDMAKLAFDRGDFISAEQRIKQAQILLLLERKGNLWLFFYLYWHFVIVGAIILMFVGSVGYKVYRKKSIGETIIDLDRRETNLKKLMIDAQKKYYNGKTSSGDFHREIAQYNNDLSDIRKRRITLRNKRIRLLSSEQEMKELESERNQTENEIKKLQNEFYVKHSISENEYQNEFKTLNERLAEIEDETTTLHLIQEKEIKKVKSINIQNRKIGLMAWLREKIQKLKMSDEQRIKRKVDKMISGRKNAK